MACAGTVMSSARRGPRPPASGSGWNVAQPASAANAVGSSARSGRARKSGIATRCQRTLRGCLGSDRLRLAGQQRTQLAFLGLIETVLGLLAYQPVEALLGRLFGKLVQGIHEFRTQCFGLARKF